MRRIALFIPLVLLGWVARSAVLVNFQVTQPPPLPKDAKQCTVKILQRVFAFSYGKEEAAQYTPPTDCGTPGSWAGISLNFTVTSNGTQYDRLGTFTFHNVEIWRTSTPEPTQGDGIIWTYLKDATRYTPLFAKPGTFILQLDNIVQPGLDGEYAIQLHATFFASSDKYPPARQADTIIPISTLKTNTGNQASAPPAFSLDVMVPQNAIEVYAELYASGNAKEEFWYFNGANKFIDDLPEGTPGQGPFREVRILVDGVVAGVAFPYATLFTGAITPSAWRPISAYGALDLPTYFLDLTPFVPILTDGKLHTITLDVASAEDGHGVNQNWYLSGSLQVITDSSSLPTTGKITSYQADPFAISTLAGSVGNTGDVEIVVTATRHIRIEAEILSGSGKLTRVVFSQDLRYRNVQNYMRFAYVQNVFQNSSGIVKSTHNGVPVVLDEFAYPLVINFTVVDPVGTTFTAKFNQAYDRVLKPAPFILGSTIKEQQVASGTFIRTPVGGTGTGSSKNSLRYEDEAGNTYQRKVDAALDRIMYDEESGTLAPSRPARFPNPPASEGVGVARMPGGARFGLGPPSGLVDL